MGRHTHVILEERQYEYLRREKLRTGLSVGELVRRALDSTYELVERPTVRGFDVSLSVWRRPDAAIVGRRPPRRAS